MEKKKLEKLYELLEQAERRSDSEAAAALRWAELPVENERIKPIR